MFQKYILFIKKIYKNNKCKINNIFYIKYSPNNYFEMFYYNKNI